MALMSRDEAARLGHETVAILRAGGYLSPSGAWVDVGSAVRAACEGTVEYPSEVSVSLPSRGRYSTIITIENDTTLRVSRRLAAKGGVVALNFASARQPGGGFLEGSRAQEEGLARSSGLYDCLQGRAMYRFHREQRDSVYSNYVIYSPDVPVFRDDEGTLLEAPWPLSIVTSPAANQSELEVEAPERVDAIPSAMTERVLKVLSVAAAHGHDQLVLGAWGCGAFGIPGYVMAPIFHEALHGPFEGVFREVVFAILDWSPERRFIGPFEKVFASPERLRVRASDLMAIHPPVWGNANKRLVFDISSPAGSVHAGVIEYSRWRAMSLPSRVDPRRASSRLMSRPGFYDYAPSSAAAVSWHVNFADPSLFHYYGSALFAQDEIQVVEHPALGALREALLAKGMKALTVEHDEATPVLVKGVERRCHVATDSDVSAGRPEGLYGNAFSGASDGAIRRATTRIDPPTVTNLIAMAAPRGGPGEYTRREIETILVTAFTAFRAAVMESADARAQTSTAASTRPSMRAPTRAPTWGAVVHTGWWGCGAFGGNRVLMATLQLLAAEMADVEQLVFHSGWPADEESLREAVGALEALGGLEGGAADVTTDAVIESFGAMRFAWGAGNGT